MKKMMIILVFTFILAATAIFVIKKDNKYNDVITVNNIYEFETDVMNVLAQDLLEKANEKDFKIKNKELILLPYDTKSHIIERIRKFKFDYLVYKRYLAVYELENRRGESAYVFFLLPENAIKNNLHTHQLPYIFTDAEKDGFYILIVSNSLVIKNLKSIYKYGEDDFVAKFKEKEEITDKKILVLLDYLNKKR